MLTGRQIREARKLLRWSRPKLSRNICLSQAFVEAAESSDGPAWLTQKQEAAIRLAFEGTGIRFEINAEGQPCALLSKAEA